MKSSVVASAVMSSDVSIEMMALVVIAVVVVVAVDCCDDQNPHSNQLQNPSLIVNQPLPPSSTRAHKA
jgi:hypothetical protein